MQQWSTQEKAMAGAAMGGYGVVTNGTYRADDALIDPHPLGKAGVKMPPPGTVLPTLRRISLTADSASDLLDALVARLGPVAPTRDDDRKDHARDAMEPATCELHGMLLSLESQLRAHCDRLNALLQRVQV